MTAQQQELRERMERAFAVCDRQIQRIEEALADLGMTMPMSVEEHADLDREQIRCLDQFIFRFSKLQDTMGAKLFRQVLAYLEEDVSDLPMIDILRLMERYGLIDQADEWTTIRELRNEIAHDYPLLENDAVAAINGLVLHFDTLKVIYGRLRKAVDGVDSLSSAN